MKNKLCDLCGTPVRVVGDVTKHYEPIWKEKEESKGEDMKDKHVINRLNEALEILYFIHSEKYKHVIKAIKYTISVIEENEKLKKHDCKKWFGEAQGCSICSNIILKSPVKSMDKMFILCEQSNWHISELQAKLATLREAVLAFKLPEKLTGGMILCGVDFCKKEYEKVIEWHNKALDEIQPLLDKLKEVAK